jgi:hypothetical protein
MSWSWARKSDWPPVRRVAWYALFIALLGWSAMVDPSSGEIVEPLPVVGWIGA